MKITKRQLRRLILEYISPEQREKNKETLAAAIDLESNNPDRPDEDLQYVKNLDDGKFYRLPAKVAKEIQRLRHPVDRKGHVDEEGQWLSVNDLLGTSNWEWSGMQGNEYGDMNRQRKEREKAAKWAADPEGEAAKKKHYDDLYAKAATDAGLDTVSGKVEVEWDLADTEFEGMPYDQAIKAAELPPVVELPGEFEEGELTDWLSDEYGYTNLGWNPVNEGRKMRITKRQLKKLIREALSRDAQDLEPRLMAVWDQVSADTLQALGGQATWEDIADEVMATGYSIDPDLIESINLLPFEEQQKLFQKAFGAGRRY